MGQNIYPVIGYTLESRIGGRLTAETVHYTWSGRNFRWFRISNVVVRGGKTKEFVITPDAVR